MKKALLFLSIFASYIGVLSQSASTKGTEFWLTFMQNATGVLTSPTSAMKLTVHFSASQSSTVTIRNISTGYSKTLNVPANTMVTDTVSVPQCYNMGSGTAVNRALLVTATSEVTMYAWNYIAATSDATVVLPTPALGMNYRIIAYKGNSTSFPSEFAMVATLDSTIIKITPSCNTKDLKPKGMPYTIMLHRGQSYQVQSKTDSSLTGSLVEVQNCKPIAVWGGSQCANVPAGCSACDHLYEQLFPLNMWGKEFILIPTSTRTKDRYVIVSDKANTDIKINGTSYTIGAAGGNYEADVSAPTTISANKPVCIALFAQGQGCGGGSGDPMMMWVTPIEQNINSIIFVAQNSAIISNHYVNIVAPTSTIGSIKLNGTNIGSSFFPVPGNTAYSYIKRSISSGTNTITSDSGFTAYAYGYGNYESYGYNVGSSIRDLNRYFTINNVNNDNFSKPSTALKICTNTAVTFKGISGTYTPLFWLWKFNDDTATAQNVTKVFTDTGLVKVMMITSWVGTNLCSANDTTLDTAIQYVRIIDPFINLITTDTSVCIGQSFKPSIALTNDSSVVWLGGTDLSCKTCIQPLITPTVSKWYKAKIGGGAIACDIGDSFFVHVIDTIKLGISADTTICAGQRVRLRSTLLNKDTTRTYIYKLFAGNTLLKQDTVGYFDISVDTTTVFTIKSNNGCNDYASPPVRIYVRPPLKVQFKDSFLICRNQNSSFTFKLSGGDSSYTVYLYENNQLKDSILNAASNTFYSFSFLPNPNATYRLHLSDGCTIINDTPEVHFMYRAPLGFTHTPDTLVCLEQQTWLNVRPNGGDSTYTFYLLKNNLVIDSIQNAVNNTTYHFTVAPNANTLYTIVLKDGCTILNDTQKITVSVRNPLSFTVSNDSNICEGRPTSIFVKPTGGNGTYTFYLLDSTAIVDSILNAVSNNIHQFNVRPTFKTKYRIVLTDGCTFKNDTHDVVYTFRAPLTFIHTPDTTICKGQPVSLRVIPFGGDSTYWFYLIQNSIVIDSIKNATLANGNTFNLKPYNTTTYTIVLSDGCTYLNDTQAVTINVRDTLRLMTANPAIICRGQNLPIDVTPFGGDSTYNIYLFRNNILLDSINNAVCNTTYNFNPLPALNSVYKFVLTDNCTIKNDTQNIVFNFRAALSFTRSNDSTICLGQSYPIRITPFGGDATYSLYLLNNGSVIDSISNASIANDYYFTVAPVLNSVYKLVLKDHCTSLNDTQTVIVNVRKPLGFTYSNDGFICEGSLTDIRLMAFGGDSTYTFYLLDSINIVDTLMNVVPNQMYKFYVHPTFKTHFKVILTDGCTVKTDTQSVNYTFRSPIGFTHTPDTLICTGQTVPLFFKPYGGDSSYNCYLVKNNLIVDSLKNIKMLTKYAFNVTPNTSTTYTLVLSDECTYLNDTQQITVSLRDPLTMNILNDSVICRGQHLRISVTPYGGDSTYILYLLNNNIIIDSVTNAFSNTTYIFDVLPPLTASYSFILKDGCTILNGKQNVSFAFRGPITFTHSPDPTICIGQKADLWVTPFGGDSTYTIYLFNNNSITDSITNAVLGGSYKFTVAPVVTNTYAIRITDGCTILNDSQSLRVSVRKPLGMATFKDTIICKGQSINIPVYPSGGDSSYTLYLLQSGVLIDSITGAIAGIPYYFSVSPIIKTQYQIAISDGCTSIGSNVFVTIDVYPPLLVKATISKPKICFGEKIMLTAQASGGALNSAIAYKWSLGAGTNRIVFVTPPVSAWYCVKADDGCSSSAYDSVYIEVEPNPIADFSADNTVGCEPFTVQFINNSVTFSNVSYLWRFGDGSIDTCRTPAPHIFAKPAMYDVTLIVVSAFGCIDSIVKKHFITVRPNPQVTLNIDPRKVKVNNGKINFIAGFRYTDDYDFYFGDGNSNLSVPKSNNVFAHIYTDTGYFIVKLEARNNFGCQTTMLDTLYVSDYYTVFIPNVFSPNNKDGVNDFFKPVSTFSKHYEMQIYDRWGALIFSETCNDRSFNCKGWDGTYHNEPVIEDTYIYVIKLTEEDNGKSYTERGTVTVVR